MGTLSTWRDGPAKEAILAFVAATTVLAENGFASYVVSGGGRDFMRPVSQSSPAFPASA